MQPLSLCKLINCIGARQRPMLALASATYGYNFDQSSAKHWQSYNLRSYSNEQENTESEGNHPYFPALSKAKLQARLETAEVENATGGLLISPWFQLYDDPIAKLGSSLLQPIKALRSAVFSPVYSRMSNIAVKMVENEVEGAFHSDEMLEGASTAVHAVIDLFSARDWAGLRKVCSSKLVDRFQIALYELEDKQGLELNSLRVVEMQKPTLRVVNLWTADNIRKFDEGWADEVSPATSASWLLATVHTQAVLEAISSRRQGAVTSTVKQHLTRQGDWMFTRGPLPKGFSSQLQLPWKVLGIC